MIEQFIQQAVSHLGASQYDIEEATSGLLSILKQNTESSDFSALLSKIGGAEALMNKFDAGSPTSSASGAFGGLIGAASSLLGGKTGGSIAGIATLLSQVKLDSGQLGSLGSLFFDFIKSEAGESLAQSLMGGLGDFLQHKAA